MEDNYSLTKIQFLRAIAVQFVSLLRVHDKFICKFF